jgi:hypothetical protein
MNMAGGTGKRVLSADDHRIMRQGLANSIAIPISKIAVAT